jgi:signal transduction histidine kinase
VPATPTGDEDRSGALPRHHQGAAADAGQAKADLRQLSVECMRTVLVALSDNSSLSEILNLVATQSMKWFGSSDVIIARLDPAKQTLIIDAAQGSQAGAGAGDLLALGLEALGHALAAQRPTLYPEGGHATAPPIDSASLPTVLAVPLLDADNLPHGGVLLYYTDPPQLSPVELELAGLVGAQATLAIRHSQQKTEYHAAATISERNRIARDLHDSVTQALYTISLITETLPQVWQSHPEEALQSIETLRILARGALAEMRTLLLELRSGEQADFNLGDLLRQLPERMFLRSKLQITTTVVGSLPLPKQVQVAFYRIAQEALNNVDKHARATRAFIQLDFRLDGTVMLRVYDNGCGIDADTFSAGQLGLSIMRERAHEIGAVLTITSQPGQGTQVTVEWDAAQRG